MSITLRYVSHKFQMRELRGVLESYSTVSQEILRFRSNRDAYYRVAKSPSLDPVLSQVDAIRILTAAVF
jgi:hypothetical protein